MNMKETAFERQFEGESRGKFIEKFFFGEVKLPVYLNRLKVPEKEYKGAKLEDFQVLKKIFQEHPMPSNEQEIIRRSQPWENPRSPENPVAKQLYGAVNKKIQAFVPKHMHNELHFYTTVNTHLDLFQGTDAIFEYYEDTGDEDLKMLAQVSLDIKTSKDQGPTIYNVTPDDSEKIQELLREKKLEEYQKIIDRYIEEWSIRIARNIEEDLKRRKTRGR